MQAMFFILDEFFCNGGDVGVFPIVGALVELANLPFDRFAAAAESKECEDEDDDEEPVNVLSLLMTSSQQVDAEMLRKTASQEKFQCSMEMVEVSQCSNFLRCQTKPISAFSSCHVLNHSWFSFFTFLQTMRASARSALAQQWTQSQHLLGRLERVTSFSKQTLMQLQVGFMAIYLHFTFHWIDISATLIQLIFVFAGQANFNKISSALPQGSSSGHQGGISLEQFTQLIRLSTDVPLDDALIARFFSIYDTDGSGLVDFKEVCCCLSTLCQSNTEDKMRLCFSGTVSVHFCYSPFCNEL
jgi:Ca2+-binding EF-hand superfamily protein